MNNVLKIIGLKLGGTWDKDGQLHTSGPGWDMVQSFGSGEDTFCIFPRTLKDGTRSEWFTKLTRWTDDMTGKFLYWDRPW